jgi:hypothetical protein
LLFLVLVLKAVCNKVFAIPYISFVELYSDTKSFYKMTFKYNIFLTLCFVTDSNRFIILSKYSSLSALYHLYRS